MFISKYIYVYDMYIYISLDMYVLIYMYTCMKWR